MSLFRLDASIRVEGSHSREIADIVDPFDEEFGGGNWHAQGSGAAVDEQAGPAPF